jgi:alanine racemase
MLAAMLFFAQAEPKCQMVHDYIKTMTFSELEHICKGRLISLASDKEIQYLLLDSRKIGIVKGSLFFAIAGDRNDGHGFIENLYQKGIRNFVVEIEIQNAELPEANIIQVHSSIKALQDIAAHHRNKFAIPIIGITGSNGKTIIKEWLSSLLAKDFSVAKNPGSYNSQVGVPLSVWQLSTHHQLGIFEAGISKPNEMHNLERIIKPTIGIFSNIGSAHDEGFVNRGQKIEEKLNLFKDCELIIYCKDHVDLAKTIESNFSSKRLLSWGLNEESHLKWIQKSAKHFQLEWKRKLFDLEFPFTDGASQENAEHCVAAMLALNYSVETIQERIAQLKSVPMRLELKQAINNCQVIDDSYNNDLGGLQIGLNFLSSFQQNKRSVIVSDILQSGLDEVNLIDAMASLLVGSEITTVVGIGPVLVKHKNQLEKRISNCYLYNSTDEFLADGKWNEFRDEIILVKGARVFQFEKIVQRLQKKIHGTVLEIDLDALVHNLNFFKSRLKPSVKLMVMVKAFAYGSGSEQIASLLQYHKIDYLGVAYADEGIELRKSGIRLPIMVMNPLADSFDSISIYNLEPEIYSFAILYSLLDFIKGSAIKIHLKLDTGMHRLGFVEDEMGELISILQENKNVSIASIFSHLAGADENQHDEFTQLQATHFIQMTNRLKSELNIQPILHILNSSGILRFPAIQFDMVRLGIGLYGVNPTRLQFDELQPVATLKTIISQIKNVKAGETIGYGRWGKAEKDTIIATIAIGYADGYSRAFSKGVGFVSINGSIAPVIGNVCMDMTMVDITAIVAKEGDEVIIFGKENPIYNVAKSINTIPYEILTNTSERVKRVFYAESI